jgi:hypothetical protein
MKIIIKHRICQYFKGGVLGGVDRYFWGGKISKCLTFLSTKVDNFLKIMARNILLSLLLLWAIRAGLRNDSEVGIVVDFPGRCEGNLK